MDGLVFAAVSAGEFPNYQLQLFHPNHFIFNFLGLLFCRLTQLARLPVQNSYQAQQFMNYLFGLAGLGLFYSWLKNGTRRYGLSLILTMFLAFSYVYWWNSTEAQVYVVSSFFLMLACWLAYGYAREKTMFNAVFFSIAACLAILAHQSNILIVPAALLLLGERRKIVLFLAALVIMVAVPYLSVMVFLEKFTSLKQAISWVLNVGSSYNQDSYMNPYWSFHPANFIFTLQSMFNVFWRPTTTAAIINWLKAAVVISLIIWGFRSSAIRKERGFRLFSGVLLATYLVFFSFWDPGNVNYLLGPGILLLFLLGLGLADELARPPERALSWSLVLVAVLIATFAFNSGEIRARHSLDNNNDYRTAADIAAVVKPGETVIISGLAGFQAGKVYLPYFYNIQAVALDIVFIRRGKENGLRFFSDQMALAAKENIPVYVLSEIFTDRITQESLKKYWQISPQEVYNVFHPYALKKVADIKRGDSQVWLYQLGRRGAAHGTTDPGGR